jgi:hypothetical protein
MCVDNPISPSFGQAVHPEHLSLEAALCAAARLCPSNFSIFRKTIAYNLLLRFGGFIDSFHRYLAYFFMLRNSPVTQL